MNRLIEKIAAATIALATIVVVSTAFASIALSETEQPIVAACLEQP